MRDESDKIILTVNEIRCIADILERFDLTLSKRFLDIYSYHAFTLKENPNHQICFYMTEKKLGRLFKKVYQPEFQFSELEDIY